MAKTESPAAVSPSAIADSTYDMPSQYKAPKLLVQPSELPVSLWRSGVVASKMVTPKDGRENQLRAPKTKTKGWAPPPRSNLPTPYAGPGSPMAQDGGVCENVQRKHICIGVAIATTVLLLIIIIVVAVVAGKKSSVTDPPQLITTTVSNVSIVASPEATSASTSSSSSAADTSTSTTTTTTTTIATTSSATTSPSTTTSPTTPTTSTIPVNTTAGGNA